MGVAVMTKTSGSAMFLSFVLASPSVITVALPRPSPLAPDFALAVGFEGAGQQNDAVSGILENFAGRKVMLLRKDFGGRHQCHLVAILDGNDRCLKSNDGFSRAHVPLQQTPHGMGLLHVIGNFFQNPFLRRRGMERENLLDRLAHAVVQLKSDSGLSFLLLALEFETKFGKE